MSQAEIGMEARPPQPRRYHAPRLAALVAGELRRRILSGELGRARSSRSRSSSSANSA